MTSGRERVLGLGWVRSGGEGGCEGLLRVGRSHSHVDVACLILNAASALPHIVVAPNWKSAHEGASCQSQKSIVFGSTDMQPGCVNCLSTSQISKKLLL